MFDIHSHILPGVDDGAEDLEESLEMARIYLDKGIGKVIATPHYIEEAESSSKKENLEVLEELRGILDKEGLDLEVYLGNELYLTMDIMDHLKEDRVSTLNNSRYLLVELPMFDIPLYIEDLIYQLQLEGYIPIIAHPERNGKIVEDPNILYEFIMQGALAQLNLPSIEGRYGSSIEDTGKLLLKHKMIHFVGTDAHSKGRRAPNVEEGLNILKKLVDDKTYEEITYSNALKVIGDKDIEVDPPIRYVDTGYFESIKDRLIRFTRGLGR